MREEYALFIGHKPQWKTFLVGQYVYVYGVLCMCCLYFFI